MSRHSILSNAEALLTAQFDDLDEREVARYWTLSDQHLLRIDRRRRDSNRFGFALQLCLLRFPGWPPNGTTLPSLAPTTGGNIRVTSISLASPIIQALHTGQDSVGRFSELRPGRTPSDPCFGVRMRLGPLSVYFCLFRLSSAKLCVYDSSAVNQRTIPKSTFPLQRDTALPPHASFRVDSRHSEVCLYSSLLTSDGCVTHMIPHLSTPIPVARNVENVRTLPAVNRQSPTSPCIGHNPVSDSKLPT